MRNAYIVVHGHGGTIFDAVAMPRSLLEFDCFWWDGMFFVSRDVSLFLRRLLSEGEDDNRLFSALRELAVSRMLAASLSPKRPPAGANLAEFSEASLVDNFPSFSIPYGPASRRKAVERMRKEGERELMKLLGRGGDGDLRTVLSRLASVLEREEGGRLTEVEAERALTDLYGGRDVASQLKELRDMEETGGDLDTVASAVFYARHLSASAESRGEPLNIRFVFVNYHEGLLGLAKLPPGDIYMADMPISTIPDLPGDLRILADKGFRLVRYEDHHPYSPRHARMLEDLVTEGLIGFQAMSGPLVDPERGEGDAELAEEGLKCGADMVYEALVMNTPADSPAMRHLRDLTHAEDFAKDRKPLGKVITELIKGGVCKVELAQTLSLCEAREDILRFLNDKGWYELVQRKRYEAAEIADRFMENVQLLEIERPAVHNSGFSGPALDEGSDMPARVDPRSGERDLLRILVALAPKTKRDEPKLNVGRACDYFADAVPGLDYLFFCYGSSVVVGRRLNQADASLNLSTLFKKIGSEKDGGHSGASVCSPESNPNYPKNILGRVSAANFALFCRYIADRVSVELGVEVRARKDISVKTTSLSTSGGGRKLLYLLLAAVLAGLLVLAFDKAYRGDGIRKGNSDICPNRSLPIAD